jgi:hypothetical protein
MEKIRLIVHSYEKFSRHALGQHYDFECINTSLSSLQEFVTGHKRENWNTGNKIQWRRLIDSGKVELIPHNQVFSIEDEIDKYPTFYLVTVPDIGSMFETNWIYWLPENIRNFLKATNIPILLSQPGEFGFEWIDSNDKFAWLSQLYLAFDRKLENEGLTNPIILHNMSKIYMKLSSDKRKYHSVYSRQWFEHARLPINLTRGTLTHEQHLENMENKKIFFCSNRAPREARCLLLLSLLKHNTLKDGYFSFLCETPATVKLDPSIINEYFTSLKFFSDPSSIESYIPYIDQAMSMLPIELEEDSALQQEHVMTNSSINVHRLNSLIEIVTETHDFTKESVRAGVLSEKVCWPIINQMPFIVLGHQENSKLLCDLGFQTFDTELVVKSYQTSNIYERVEYINSVIKRFSSLTTSQKHDWLNSDSVKAKIKHNYELLINTNWNHNEIDALIESHKTVTSATMNNQ